MSSTQLSSEHELRDVKKELRDVKSELMNAKASYQLLRDNNDTLRQKSMDVQQTNLDLAILMSNHNKTITRLEQELKDAKTEIDRNNHQTSQPADIFQLGPASDPVEWTGNPTDLVQLLVRGEKMVAVIFTNKMVADWNCMTKAAFKANEIWKHVSQEREEIKDLRETLERDRVAHHTPGKETKIIDGRPYQGDTRIGGENPLSKEELAEYNIALEQAQARIKIIQPQIIAAYNVLDPLRKKADRMIRKRFLKAGLFSWSPSPEQWLVDLWNTKLDKDLEFYDLDENDRLIMEMRDLDVED